MSNPRVSGSAAQGWSFLSGDCQANIHALTEGHMSTTELFHSRNIRNIPHTLLMVERPTSKDPKPDTGEHSICKRKSLG